MPYKDKENRWQRGLCIACPKSTENGSVRCTYHLAIDSKRKAVQKKKRKEQGLCRDCGKALSLTAREDYSRCVNCADIRVQKQWLRRETK
jgi:hypothetical protein